jgi:hypothetical protein
VPEWKESCTPGIDPGSYTPDLLQKQKEKTKTKNKKKKQRKPDFYISLPIHSGSPALAYP